MSFYTIYDLKRAVNTSLPGNGVAQLNDFFDTADKGRRALVGKVRPEELIRKAYIENAIFPNVDQYSVPDDLKYDDVIEIKRLAGYRNVDSMDKPLELVYRRRFGQKRGSAANVMNIGYENGIKYARMFRMANSPNPTRSNQPNCTVVPIQTCDSLSDNGTWNVSGNCVNLREDKLLHVIGQGSLQFDINNSSTNGALTNFTLTPFDLSLMLQRGATFSWFNLPIPKEMVSITIKMGSDATNMATDYYYGTVNQPHDNNAFIPGWNLLKYLMRNIAQVGTPNPKVLTWISFEFQTTGNPIPSCNMDNILARVGTVYEMVYNSAWMFMDAFSGAWKKIPTANSDIIIAEEDTFNILVDETTIAAMDESYAASSPAASGQNSVAARLIERYKKFNMEHKSEALLESDEIHVFGNMYDGYSDDTMPGFGNQYGQFGDGGAPETGSFGG